MALMMAGEPGGVSLATATSCFPLESSSERTVSVWRKSRGDEIVSFFNSFILLNLPATKDQMFKQQYSIRQLLNRSLYLVAKKDFNQLNMLLADYKSAVVFQKAYSKFKILTEDCF